MVLRCDDCISYHVAQCKEAGVTREEFFEVFSVGLVVGGSIVIPHLRRAVDFLDQLESGDATQGENCAFAREDWGEGTILPRAADHASVRLTSILPKGGDEANCEEPSLFDATLRARICNAPEPFRAIRRQPHQR
jgi:hypothetical protein